MSRRPILPLREISNFSPVIKSLRIYSFIWLGLLVTAIGFLLWLNLTRIQHIQHVDALGEGEYATPASFSPASSSTAEITPENGLIVPEQFAKSYHWIAQTQRMFNRHEGRVRQIEYENAPLGRAVYTTSPYRWWLSSIAWIDHIFSGRPASQTVERAALIADPLLHLLFLLIIASVVARRLGTFAATLVSVGVVAFFPFAANFFPGAPDDRTFSLLFALTSVLLLAAGAVAKVDSPNAARSTQNWFIAAGVVGGLACWLSVSIELPVLIGIALGGVIAAWVSRSKSVSTVLAPLLPWRSWAVTGGVTTLIAYIVEYAPAHLGDWRFEFIHPVYSIAWLGVGEILAQGTDRIEHGKKPMTARAVIGLILASAALVLFFVLIRKKKDVGLFIVGADSFNLTKLLNSASAENFVEWIRQNGFTPTVWATISPTLLIVSAIWILLKQRIPTGHRRAVALTLGPVAVALGFAFKLLFWWNVLDAFLLVMLATIAASLSKIPGRRGYRFALAGATFLFICPGILLITPHNKPGAEDDLTHAEVTGLIERDLARWLTLRSEPEKTIVLAPPAETTALCYYGSIRGLSSLSLENKKGVNVAVRILSSQYADDAKQLIEERGVSHIILFSWDTSFDDYARVGAGKIEGTFRDLLHLESLPLWLRPLAYQLPGISGFEGQFVIVLKVVPTQTEAMAMNQIAAYFLEIGDLNNAGSVGFALQRFPTDLRAWIARAEIAAARQDEGELSESLEFLKTRLAKGNQSSLQWDQRVRLAAVLARAEQMPLARAQLEICLTQIDEQKLRDLPPSSVYRLLVLCRGFGLKIDDSLSQLARTLIPAEMRERLR